MTDTEDRLENPSANEQKAALINSDEQLKTKAPDGRLTMPLFFAVFAATVGGSFQFGYHIGCVNAPEKIITEWYKKSYNEMNGKIMTHEAAEFAWSISVGIFAVGGMIGALMSGWLADKIGRKGALLANNVIAFVGAILMTSSKYAGVYYLLTIGRFLIGVNSGLNSGLVPMYVTEISPPNLRGAIGSVCQLLVTIAILTSQILGLPFIFGNEQRWPFIFAFSIVPIAIMLICLPLCAESPNYNLIVKGRKEQAEKDLIKFRGTENVAVELEIIDEEAKASRSQAQVTFGDMFGAALRWPLFIAIMMMLAQQLSGINATMFYSTKIFREAGLPGNGPVYATIAMGAINVVQTLVSVWLVDHPKFGRRSLMLAGMIGMFIAAVLTSISLTLVSQKNAVGETKHQWASYAAIVFVLLFVVAFATGPGSIPWFYVSEIFPSNARGKANSLACMSNWLANFVVAVSFPAINGVLKHFTFLVFAGLLAFFIIFTYKFVPETKNKSVEEIQRAMSTSNRAPASQNVTHA